MLDVACRPTPTLRAPARLAAAGLLPTILFDPRGGDPTDPPDVTGTYTLRSVNGQRVPMRLGQDEDFAYYVSAGAVELRADGRYTSSLTFRFTAGGQLQSQSEQDGGTYAVSGSSVTLRSDGGGSTMATVSGGRLTSSVPLAEGGVLTVVFEK